MTSLQRRLLDPLLAPWRWLRHRHRQRYQAQLIRSGWYELSARSTTAAVFIGGCPRSGTTLLRELLDRHSGFACGIETSLLIPGYDSRRIAERCQLERREVEQLAAQCRTLVEMADRFYGELAARRGKARWVDKAPWNVRVINRLLTWFPNGRFLHLVRDGRDLVCSLRHHPRQVLRRGRVRSVSTNQPIDQCAVTWHDETSQGLAYAGHPRYLEVRYEHLVGRPEAELQRVCRFLDEQYEPAMLIPDTTVAATAPAARLLNNPLAAAAISTASVGRWQRDLSLPERHRFAEIAGELLLALGYVKDHGWLDG